MRRGHIWGTTPAFTWKDRGKPRTICHDTLFRGLDSTWRATNTNKWETLWFEPRYWLQNCHKHLLSFYLSCQCMSINCTVLQSRLEAICRATQVWGITWRALAPPNQFPWNISCCDLCQVKWATKTCLCQTYLRAFCHTDVSPSLADKL
jgi:hypothetical protein